MRLIVQRVKEAKVEVDGAVVGEIDHGLLALLGVHKEDSAEQIPWLAQKLANLRIFGDDAGKMNRSVRDTNGAILVVSQFTLYGNCQEGRRPEFTSAAPGPLAERLYEQFVTQLRSEVERVETGRFAAKMEVSLVNDGPVTLLVEG
jgi:D-aminoacyl-tRNA deacylase